MNLTFKSTWIKMAAVAVALTIGVSAHAEGPREELIHAHHLLKTADNDYDGHKGEALKQLEIAGKKLGLKLGTGEWPEHEKQWKSDERVAEARKLLRDAREKLEDRDRD